MAQPAATLASVPKRRNSRERSAAKGWCNAHRTSVWISIFARILNIWSDASGTSAAVATYDNMFYVDSTATGARGGDTVVFSGTLVTNALTDRVMAGALVAFIKDFSPSCAYYGEQTVQLQNLTNGQTFTFPM